MKRKLIFLAILILSFSSLASGSNLLDLVVKHYRNVNTISGSFIQTAIFPDGRTKTFQGSFWIADDKSRWDYKPPDEQVVLTVGNRIYIYDPFSQQIQEGTFPFASVYKKLLTDPKRLKENFSLKEKKNTLLLFPKGDSQVKSIQVNFDNNLNVKSIVVLDSAGNRTILRFTKVEFNKPIPKGIFRLSALTGEAK